MVKGALDGSFKTNKKGWCLLFLVSFLFTSVRVQCLPSNPFSLTDGATLSDPLSQVPNTRFLFVSLYRLLMIMTGRYGEAEKGSFFIQVLLLTFCAAYEKGYLAETENSGSIYPSYLFCLSPLIQTSLSSSLFVYLCPVLLMLVGGMKMNRTGERTWTLSCHCRLIPGTIQITFTFPLTCQTIKSACDLSTWGHCSYIFVHAYIM